MVRVIGLSVLQCFDTVGWATASILQKPTWVMPRFLFETFGPDRSNSRNV